MTHEEQLKNLGYRNWVKAGIALMYLKDGIGTFVDDGVKDVQKTFLQDIKNNLSDGIEFCDGCTTKNVIPCPTYGICNVRRRGGICNYHDNNYPSQSNRKCPNNVCDRLCQKIEDHHRYTPTWKNTDATKWCKNHWEIAKCFLPLGNYVEKTSASETDCSDLLNVIVNCLPMQNMLNAVINPPHDIVSKNIEARNAILNSPKLELAEPDLHEYIDGMITLLQDTKILVNKPDTILAVENLKQLKLDKLTGVISTNDSIDIREQALAVKTEEKKAIDDIKAKIPLTIGDRNIMTVLYKLVRCKRRMKRESTYPPPKRLKGSLDLFLKEGSKNYAECLLKSNHLPSEKELELVWYLWGDISPDLIENMCKGISDQISKMSENIICVYPTYNATTKDNIVFIVVSNCRIDIKTKYTVMHRSLGEYNEEGKTVSTHVADSKSQLSYKDREQLLKCIENNSKRLLKNHSNITMIASCPVKCTNFLLGEKGMEFKQVKCVVIYVTIKGHIPINEKPFPKYLDDIPIDVREGGFEFCSNDTHMLQMGCRIMGSSSYGTLGPFVDYENDTCFLTSAHVVLNHLELNDLKTRKTIKWNHMEGPKVHLIGTDNNDYIGNVIKAEHRCGGDGKAGVEVAVVAAYRRHVKCGNCNFPDEGYGRQNAYTSGQICFPSQFPEGTHVVMFGGSTKHSDGKFRSNDAVIRKPFTLKGENWSFDLHNQIIIDPLEPEKEFGQPGDSGSLVFVPFENDTSDLRAFGIFEGKTSFGEYIVTPIKDILEVLQHPKMKVFNENANEISEIKNEIQSIKTQMVNNLSTLMAELQSLKQHIQV